MSQNLTSGLLHNDLNKQHPHGGRVKSANGNCVCLIYFVSRQFTYGTIMTKKQRKIEKALLKDIKRAQNVGDRNTATENYRCFISACAMRKNSKL